MRKRNVFTTTMRRYNHVPFEDIPEVSPALIKKLLSNNGLSIEDGYTCFITKCCICKSGKSEAKANAKLYVNKTTGKVLSCAVAC